MSVSDVHPFTFLYPDNFSAPFEGAGRYRVSRGESIFFHVHFGIQEAGVDTLHL